MNPRFSSLPGVSKCIGNLEDWGGTRRCGTFEAEGETESSDSLSQPSLPVAHSIINFIASKMELIKNESVPCSR